MSVPSFAATMQVADRILLVHPSRTVDPRGCGCEVELECECHPCRSCRQERVLEVWVLLVEGSRRLLGGGVALTAEGVGDGVGGVVSHVGGLLHDAASRGQYEQLRVCAGDDTYPWPSFTAFLPSPVTVSDAFWVADFSPSG